MTRGPGERNELEERADSTVDITFDEVLHQQEVGNADTQRSSADLVGVEEGGLTWHFWQVNHVHKSLPEVPHRSCWS